MNHEKLSLRLERVAIHIPEGSILADIGSDHAYLPCYAVKKGLVKMAIAGEVSEGPYQSACNKVRETGLGEHISVRKGDGLEVLSPGEATVISIAGMGGTLISSILENGKTKLSNVKKLILQPNVGANHVRMWLIENGWELADEEILEEDGKIYEILAAEPGDPLKPYGVEKESGLLFGPFLMKEKNDAFIKRWTLEKEHWKKISGQLSAVALNTETEERRNVLLARIKMAEEVLGI
ncbi:tRNA (adenine(22)-N(1))-methyltransferase [Actinomycetes bacterium NPDC127524]